MENKAHVFKTWYKKSYGLKMEDVNPHSNNKGKKYDVGSI